MPSFNRLLVLAVVALAASVHSAPVADDIPRDLANVNGAVERSVAPAPVNDIVDEDLVTEDFDEDDELEARDVDEEEDEDELEAREFDEDEDDEDVEAREFDDEDEDDSALERRSKRKTTKAAKPKATKAAKPKTTKAKTTKVKTTKAPKPTTTKATKTTKAKTTKAKTTKVKTTAKATATKPAKTTKSAKPTKSAKVTKTKASKTTKASATAKPSACPIKKPTKPAKKTRMLGRAFDYISHLFARDTEEFIGWHGTNSDTATFWAEKGQLERPVKADGALDFLGLGPKTTAGKSGADAEIGPGVYITDQKEIAVAFANGNAKVNKGTTAQICAIFAKSSSNWRTAIRKSFIPENLVGDSSDAAKKKQLEDARLAHVKKAVPGVTASTVVKFSLLNRSEKSGQLVLPSSITNHFLAKCFNVNGGATAAGTSNFPAFSYNGQTLRSEWNIAAETAGECPA